MVMYTVSGLGQASSTALVGTSSSSESAHVQDNQLVQSSGSANSQDESHQVNLKGTLVQLNQQLQSSNLKVEFAADEPPHQIWIDVIDQSTGQVIQKIPSEILRKFAETQQLSGLNFDRQF